MALLLVAILSRAHCHPLQQRVGQDLDWGSDLNQTDSTCPACFAERSVGSAGSQQPNQALSTRQAA